MLYDQAGMFVSPIGFSRGNIYFLTISYVVKIVAFAMTAWTAVTPYPL